MSAELERLFLAILTKGGRKDNTYKFALARFLLDYSHEQDQLAVNEAVQANTGVAIPYDRIAQAFLRYYWHQECMYKIQQNRHPEKPPAVIRVIREQVSDGYVPAAYDSIDERDKDEMIRKIRMKVFDREEHKTSIVIPTFQNIVDGNTVVRKQAFYDYDDDRGVLTLKPAALLMFRKNYDILTKSVFLEWAKYIESINMVPRLIEKIGAGSPDYKPPKLALKVLQKDFRECFYCDARLGHAEIGVDHFIPQTYIFDDELWNLVLACKECSRKKGNLLVDEGYLGDLLKRNERWGPKISLLESSIKNIDRGRGWRNVIEMHYTNCRECGYDIQKKMFFYDS